MATPRKHWFKVADSIRDESWSNDQLAFLIRLMAELNTRWARNGLPPDSAHSIELNSTDLMAISGKHRADVARKSAERLADIASISISHRGDITLISWPKYSEFQGLVPRELPESRPLRKTPPQDARRKTGRAPSAPPAPRAPRSAKSLCPDRLEPEARARILKWAGENHKTTEQVAFGWQALKDWSRSKSESRTDWEAAFRNALRSGWVLEGYAPPAGTPSSRYRDADDVIATAKQRQAEDDARARAESPEAIGELIDLSLRQASR
jgi:hypothetical protein